MAKRKRTIERDLGKKFARGLINAGAFMDKTQSPGGEGFRLKLHQTQPDAPLSPFYMNLRVLQSTPQMLKEASWIYRSLGWHLYHDAFQFKPDLLAGIPMAGTPIATALSLLLDVPMITPRQPKEHGTQGSIDGKWTAGQTVLLIDDLITKSDSKIEAADVLKAAGLIPKAVIVLVDREQGGHAGVKAAGMWFKAAFTIHELIDFYLAEKLISNEVGQEILEYLDANS